MDRLGRPFEKGRRSLPVKTGTPVVGRATGGSLATDTAMLVRLCSSVASNYLKKLIKDFRCIAVADGFYEWKREEKEKTPHYFVREDKKPIFLAGIYESDQFCLITEEASDNIKEIHHRQPVILNQTDVNRYLNLELSGSSFLKEANKPKLIFHEVSKDVNKPTNNTASLVQSITN